jgi:hypothetical protein
VHVVAYGVDTAKAQSFLVNKIIWSVAPPHSPSSVRNEVVHEIIHSSRDIVRNVLLEGVEWLQLN